MKPQIKVEGMQRVSDLLRSMGERVPDIARGRMKRAAARIVRNAKNYVPEDTEALKDSIRISKNYGVRGRLEIEVTFGSGGGQGGGAFDAKLEQYAMIVHERYEEMIIPEFAWDPSGMGSRAWGFSGRGPSQKTLDKMERFPGKVGSRFLTRAADEETERLREVMIEDIRNYIEKAQK